MKKIQSLLLLIIIIMPAMANANWAGSLVEVKGIGFLPNDKQKNIQVNFTLRMNPPSNYSEGHKIETLLLKKGNITIQDINRIYSVLVAAMHAEQACYLWLDHSIPVHRNCFKFGDSYRENS
jgi:hypothetical protein